MALGQIGPQTEVIKVSVSATLSNDRVAQLLVKRGDRVTAGQVIAILDSRDRLQGVLAKAKEQVSVAQAELAQVQAGAKSGEIAAQQAEIARLQAELTGDTQRVITISGVQRRGQKKAYPSGQSKSTRIEIHHESR